MAQFAKFTDAERQLVRQIVKRAVTVGIYTKARDCEMDIAATAYHRPLRLADLLAADAFTFAHDMNGIRNNLNRQTGKLENFFEPRTAAPEPAKD